MEILLLVSGNVLDDLIQSNKAPASVFVFLERFSAGSLTVSMGRDQNFNAETGL